MFYAFKDNCIWFSFILMWLCLHYSWGNGTTQEVYKIIWLLYIMYNVYLKYVKCNFPVSYSLPDRKHPKTLWNFLHTLVSMYSMFCTSKVERGWSLASLRPQHWFKLYVSNTFSSMSRPHTVMLDAVLNLLTELLWYVYELYYVVYHMGCIFCL